MPSKVPGPFVNLHVHTDKSILDGFSHIHDLARLAAEDGAPALALTDHKNISNTIQLFHACEKYGIKAIPGLEAHFFPEIAKYKNRAGTGQKSRYHSVILAKSDQGYKNLVKITSIMHDSKHRFGLYPMADFELFDTYSKGLIGTTACIGGLSNQLILQGDEKGAYDAVSKFVDIFGKQNFFIELQNHGIPEEKKLIPELMRMSKKMKLKTIVTGDSHYDTKADARAHDALLAINSGSSINDPNRFRFHGSNNYYHTAALAYKLFPEKDFPGAVSNTLLVADMVNVSDPSKVDPILPQYPFLGKYKSDTEMLRAMCEDGLRRMFSDPSGRVRQEYRDRVEEELGVIEPKGFPSYFLFLSDICMWLKSRGIPLGPGRGSAAGSLVALLVGITNVDPIPHGLFFSRFLNADREGLPDIDIDIDATRRQEVIDYMKEHFGEEQCAQICSWGTLKALSSIDDSNRVLGGKVSDAEYVKSLYPAIKEVPKLKILLSEEEPEKEEHIDAWKMASKMREEYESDSHYGEVIELASELEGSIKSIGRHAAGILITPGEVSDYFPIFEASEDSGLPRSQYDKYDIEEAGGLKLDLLSLSNLSVIDRACQLIRLETGKEIDPWNLPINDPATFKMLAAGETGAVFQVSREGITKLLVLMNINSFDQLVAAVALYRPGPMGVNAHLDFAKRATGKQKITSLHPKFTEILSDTYALIVYQEQVMLVSQVFAGFTGVEADNFRRAMGKKNSSVMEAQHEKFIEGCVANGYTEKLGRDIWDIVEPFSQYAFNKCITKNTKLQIGAANQHSDGFVTVGDLYRRIYGTESIDGRCAACDSEPSTKRRFGIELCSRCFAWRKKFSQTKHLQTPALGSDGRIRMSRLKDVYYNGVRDTWKITLENGMSITATENHRHRTPKGWKRVDKLKVGDELLTIGEYEKAYSTKQNTHTGWTTDMGDRANYRDNATVRYESPSRTGKSGYINGAWSHFLAYRNAADVCEVEGCTKSKSDGDRIEIAHLDGDRSNNDYSNLKAMCVSHHKAFDYQNNERPKRWEKGRSAIPSKIVSIEYAGKEDVYDVEMDDEEHNWIGNGIVTHNSHSVAYAYVTLATAYLKRHYPSQFLAAYIDSSFFSSKPEEFARLLSYATEQGVRVLPPNINVSSSEATTLENTVYIGIGRVSGCNAKATKAIISNRSTYGPFASLSDFIERLQGTAVSKNAVYGLIHSGAFDELHDSRLAMSEAVEDMFNIAKSVHNSIDSVEDSAFNIFDFADEDDVPTKAIEEFDLTGDDYTVRERRSHEFAAIGMFAGSHPFEDFKPLIPQLIELERIPKNAVPANPDVLEDYIGKVVSMYGIVGGLEQKVAKKSKREYTKFRIETQMGRSIESVVWGLAIDDEERGSLAVVTGKVTEKTRETFDENGDSEGIERYIEFSARSFATVDTDISERRQRKARLSIVDGGDKKRERREQRVKSSRNELEEKRTERASRKPRTSRLKESSRTNSSSRSRSKSSSENVVSLPTLNRVTFIVEKRRDLQNLQKKLDSLEEGSVHVYVTFDGERYDLGSSFALSRKDVSLIEEELGIRVRLPQINRSSRRK